MTTAVAVKERPILFSGEMVRAILEGRKVQTRRVIKPLCGALPHFLIKENDPYPYYYRRADAVWDSFKTVEDLAAKRCPYGKRGDRFWVRETWCYYGAGDAHIGYRATDEICADAIDKWRPSIHMPRALSRLTLEVTEVRVQRLQDISEGDAIAEGIPKDEWFGLLTVQQDFQKLWDSINANKHPWDSNPWVWVVGFKQLGGE